MGVMKSIVPITRFNKGEANRIFEEVKSSGTKIVMKNNRPEQSRHTMPIWRLCSVILSILFLSAVSYTASLFIAGNPILMDRPHPLLLKCRYISAILNLLHRFTAG